ncbi:response regulator transcription factor [Paenibacillus sp. MZ04-78.2]|uniref:response regulator transcription factor n=1 Tax=Paenibacillus sp. MZ04-78.2 TaxID=2962034 RepID=UPI0020B65ECF|nr:response regulator transcription factor [Paenibacillus sp. MZ04-78.2]MCP3776136.1 response regulator transcription factor [Paenibacillus sp. MZ04-78.2]
MYKIMVVDDEAIVREGIKEHIDWNGLGFELVGDYASGREAWEAIEQLRPDLVLSDICMPFMDGLELTRLIRTRYPFVKVIILTGFDDFDYAQQALRLKAYDFILKPVTAADLRALLKKVKGELDEETRQREDLTRLHMQLNQSLPLLKERFLERWATTAMGEAEIRERLRYFGLPEPRPDYVAMVVDIDDFGSSEHLPSDQDQELLRFAVYNMVQEIVGQENGISFRTREERVVAIVSGLAAMPLYELAYQLAETVRQFVEKYLKLTVSLGVGRVCGSLEQLPLAYKSALSALEYRLLLGKNQVIGIVDMEGQPPAAPDNGAEWNRLLASAVKTGTTADIHRLIEQLVTHLKTSRLPIEACYWQIQSVIVTLMNTVRELGADEPRAAIGERNWLTDVYRFKTLDDIRDWLKHILSLALEQISEQRNRLTHTQVLRATEYIREHYVNDKLSLQELCRHTLMSTSYFSTVFKQQLGETFVEYLTRVRIDKAKELLLHTSLKSYEIASQVGYADPNYFSLIFKKHSGLTPTEYRDSAAKEPRR